jgi:Secretion system C-terminal sorting domain
MKKILITMFFVCAINTIAQTSNPLDNQLKYVNQSTATSGIIYERSQRNTTLFAYNQPGNIHNTANFGFFKQALGELHQASNKTKLIAVPELQNRIANNTTMANEVNIGIINASFQVMNYDTANPANGGLTFDGAFFRQIAGKVPFYNLQAVVIAPLKNTVSGSTNTYRFNNNLILNNGDFSIKTMIANFGDGTNRTRIDNNILVTNSVSLPNNLSNATQKITFTITLSNNINITTYGEIFVSRNTVNNSATRASACDGDLDSEDLYPITNLIEAEESYQGINETVAIKGKLEVKVFYDTNHQKTLRKPILIIDGFDPGDKRKITDCDCENDPTGDCQYASRDKATGQYDPKNHKSLQELMGFNDSFGVNDNLIRILRSKGYDVVVVNQPTYTTAEGTKVNGGADFIERNGLALVTLIKSLNGKLQQNGSTEKLVVVGPSMGGQISRYALAYMEKKQAEATTAAEQNKWKHNARLWIAFDSPNHGANVPFGDQALINILRDGGANADADDTYKNSINSIASKELLIELHEQSGTEEQVNQSFLNGSTISQGMPTNAGNPYFQAHYNNQFNNGLPNSKGFPMNLHKIAIVNGSLSGVRPQGNNNSMILDVRLFTQTCISPINVLGWSPSICYTTKLATAQSSLLPATGINAEIASLKKLGVSGQYTRVTNVNNRGNLDILAGGLVDATAIIHSTITGTNPIQTRGSFWQYLGDNLTYWHTDGVGNGTQWETYTLNPNQCFIPTFSGIGIKNPNQNWANPLNRNLVCSNETYFDSYFGENNNTPHVELNYRSVNWLLKEIGSNTSPPAPQAPIFPLQANLISGPSSICDNTTFTFGDVCKLSSSVITWTVTPSTQLITSTPYSVTINGFANSEISITATFQNGQTTTKTIWSGKPALRVLDTYSNIPYDSTLINSPYWDPVWSFKTNNTNSPVDEFIFKDLSDNLIIAKPAYNGYGSISANELSMGYGDTKSFYVYTKNSCGFVNPTKKALVKTTIYCPTLCELGIGVGCNLARMANTNNSFYKIYPNPSANIINVDLKNQDQKPNPKARIIAELYNMMGEIKKSIALSNSTATIDVSGLPKGIYILKINTDEQMEKHTISVE